VKAPTPTFRSAAIESALFQGVALALGLLWLVFVTRMVPPEGAGTIFVAFTVANSAAALTAFGLPQSFAVRYPDLGPARLVSNGLALSFVMALLSSIAVAFALHLFWRSAELYYLGIPMVPAIVFVLYLGLMLSSMLRSMLAMRAANIASAAPMIIFNLALSIAYISALRMGVGEVLGLMFVAYLAAAAFALAVVVAKEKLDLSQVRSADMRALMSFGGTVHVGHALKEVMYRADLLVVQALLGPSASAQYGLVRRIIDAVARFVDALCLNIVPYIVSGDERSNDRIIHHMMDLVLVSFVPLALLASIVAGPLTVGVFGVEYQAAGSLLRIAVWAIVPLGIWKVLANNAIAHARLRRYIASAAVGAALIVSGNLFLMPQFGLPMTVGVLLAAYTLAMAVLWACSSGELRYVPLRALSGSLSRMFAKGSESRE
jgi:O-antigen/teichoic acid export membrane protein